MREGHCGPNIFGRLWSAILLVALVGLLLTGFGITPVAADAPGEPIAFHGEAEGGDGTPAPVGTELVAAVDGEEVDRITVESTGVYAGDSATDEKLRTHTGAGDTVTFHVEAVDGPRALETHAITNPGVYERHLTFPEGTFDPEGEHGDEADELGEDDSDGDDETGGVGTGQPGPGQESSADDPSALDEGEESPSDIDPIYEEVAPIEVDDETGAGVVQFTDNASVERITLDDARALEEATVTVTELTEPPATAGGSAETSLQTIQIDVPDQVTDSAAEIEIRLDSTVLDEHDVDEGDLVVRHFDDTTAEWHDLETTVDDTTADGELVVTATTAGFSYFSIVATAPPTATITVEEARVDAVTLSAAESTDRYGSIESYEWVIAGERLTGPLVTTSVEAPGTLAVELSVTNSDGLTNTTHTTVTVEPALPGDEGTDDGDTHVDQAKGDRVPGFGVTATIGVLFGVWFLLGRCYTPQ